MLITHAREIIDRRLGHVRAEWYQEEDTTAEGAVESIRIAPDNDAFLLAIDGLPVISAPFPSIPGTLRDSDVLIPHESDPLTATALSLFTPDGDPIDLLESAGIDVLALNESASQDAGADSLSKPSEEPNHG